MPAHVGTWPFVTMGNAMWGGAGGSGGNQLFRVIYVMSMSRTESNNNVKPIKYGL